MEKFICNFCNKEFTYKHNLTAHQKTTKKCILIQEKIKIKNKISICQYCNKEFANNQNLSKHVCLTKTVYLENELKKSNEQLEVKNTQITDLEIENRELKKSNEQLEVKNTQITDLEIENKELKIKLEKNSNNSEYLENEIKCLNLTINEQKTQIEFLKEQLTKSQEQLTKSQDQINKIAEIGVKKETTRNTYKINQKILNQLVPYDITPEKIDRIVQEKFTDGHLIQGKQGIVNIAAKNILKDEQGNKKLVCTDVARRTFVGKDEKGNEFKDHSCVNFMSSYIPSIEKKSFEILNEYEENEELDEGLIDEVRKKAIDIQKFKENPTLITNDLAKILAI